MMKKLLAVYLVLVVLLAVFVPGCTGGTQGTIEVKATLDGVAWNGTVNYTLTGPGTAPTGTTSVPKSFTVDAGNWTCAYVSGGPAGAVFVNITPSPTQSLTAGGNITFTLNFVTPMPVDAYVTFQTWTINGLPVVPGPVYWLNPGDWIDCEYLEHVDGEEGEVVTVHQTSWLKVHNTGIEGAQGPDIVLHVVNHPDAVKMNPPAEKKANQQCTVEGAPVDVCTMIPLHYCEPVNLDVEVDWELKICTNYTKRSEEHTSELQSQ